MYPLLNWIVGRYLSQTALGELYAGAYRSMNPEKNLRQIEVLLEAVAVLSPDQTTAHHYGQLSSKLSQSGRLIPHNDLWIAALAMQCDLPLATLDRHFERVPDLKVELW